MMARTPIHVGSIADATMRPEALEAHVRTQTRVAVTVELSRRKPRCLIVYAPADTAPETTSAIWASVKEAQNGGVE